MRIYYPATSDLIAKLFNRLRKFKLSSLSFYRTYVTQTLVAELNNFPHLANVYFKGCTYTLHLLNLQKRLYVHAWVSSTFFDINMYIFAHCNVVTVTEARHNLKEVICIDRKDALQDFLVEHSQMTLYWMDNKYMKTVISESREYIDMRNLCQSMLKSII